MAQHPLAPQPRTIPAPRSRLLAPGNLTAPQRLPSLSFGSEDSVMTMTSPVGSPRVNSGIVQFGNVINMTTPVAPPLPTPMAGATSPPCQILQATPLAPEPNTPAVPQDLPAPPLTLVLRGPRGNPTAAPLPQTIQVRHQRGNPKAPPADATPSFLSASMMQRFGSGDARVGQIPSNVGSPSNSINGGIVRCGSITLAPNASVMTQPPSHEEVPSDAETLQWGQDGSSGSQPPSSGDLSMGSMGTDPQPIVATGVIYVSLTSSSLASNSLSRSWNAMD